MLTATSGPKQPDSQPYCTVMSPSSHEGTSRRYLSTDADNSASPPENGENTLRTPNPSSILLGASHDSTHAKQGLDTLRCPVPGCSSVFKGKIPHGYLLRHLGRPGLYGLTTDEKASWENLHKIERDRLLATRSMPLSFYKPTHTVY